jgi:isopenicillin-N epimerase
LRQRGVVGSVTPYATQYARLAPGLLNSTEEIDRTLAIVRDLRS